MGDWTAAPDLNSLDRNGQTVHVEPKIMQVLVTLARHPHQVCAKEYIFQRVWPGAFVSDEVLTRSVSELRRVFEDSPQKPTYIQTIPKGGYRLIASVVPLAEDHGGPVPAGWREPKKWVFITTVATILTVLVYVFRPALSPPRIGGYTQITHDGQQKSFQGQLTSNLLTDGPRIYVQENIDGHFVVAQVLAMGGETVPISTGLPNVVLENISADKSELLVGSFMTGGEAEQTQWAFPITGGAPRRLGTAGDATRTPNGDLLFSHQNELQVLARDANTPRNFASVPGLPYSFRWSPDGRVLRFTMVELGRGPALWEISSNGANLHRLLQGWHEPALVSQGNWTPDGKYFVFQVFVNGRLDIWAMREKRDWLHRVSRQPVQLTSGPLNFHSPQPSTDGKKIFVVGEQARAELERYDEKSRQFVPYLGGISASGVTFSPDGQWVAYVSYPDDQIWRSRANGSEKLQLTSVPDIAASPRWSPDGKEIVFLTFGHGQPHISVIPREGGYPRVVYATRNALDRPSWMPSGKAIIFGEWTASDEVIKILDLKTLSVKSLPDSKGLWFPLVSSDGRFLAANTANSLKPKLFDFTTQKWSELAQLAAGLIEWSRDNRYVYFDTGLSKDPAFYRIRIADRKLERIVTLKNFRRVVSGEVSWSGLSPEGAPLLMRDSGTQEVYALDFQAP